MYLVVQLLQGPEDLLREDVPLLVEEDEQALLSLHQLGQEQVVHFLHLVRNEELLAGRQPLEHGLGLLQISAVLDVLPVPEEGQSRESSDPELSSPIELRRHDEDDAVLVQVGVDLLQAVDDLGALVAVVVVGAEAGEQDGHVLVLLDDVFQHGVGDVLDGGRVALLDQPLQEGLRVSQGPLLVQEGDVVLVVHDDRRIFHSDLGVELGVGDLDEPDVVLLAVVVDRLKATDDSLGKKITSCLLKEIFFSFKPKSVFKLVKSLNGTRSHGQGVRVIDS